MAHILISTSLLLLFTLSATTSGVSASLSAAENLRELETMMETLRPLGYTLFCNAITTSDLQFQILSSNPKSDDFYTIFAAKDPFLYALDMASDAAAYVSTLRYHVSPNRRLTHSDLRNLDSPFLETLLPHYSILVSKSSLNGTVSGNSSVSVDVVRVDGVRISDPDLFVGSRIVVHGLDGILVTGIVKNDDLVEDPRGLGLVIAPTAAPVVIPLPEEDASVLPPSSAPPLPPGVVPAIPPPVPAPSQVVAPAPEVVPDTPPPFPEVAVPSPMLAPEPVVAPDQGVVPPGDSATDVEKGSKERRGEKHHPKPKKATDGGKGTKEGKRVKHQPPVEKATDGGKGLKEGKRGAKHQPLKEKETDGRKGLKEARQGAKHKQLPEKETDGGKGSKEVYDGGKGSKEVYDGGKGSKEAKRAKHHHVTHLNHHHQVKHNNRRHQSRRNRVHRKDDL